MVPQRRHRRRPRHLAVHAQRDGRASGRGRGRAWEPPARRTGAGPAGAAVRGAGRRIPRSLGAGHATSRSGSPGPTSRRTVPRSAPASSTCSTRDVLSSGLRRRRRRVPGRRVSPSVRAVPQRPAADGDRPAAARGGGARSQAARRPRADVVPGDRSRCVCPPRRQRPFRRLDPRRLPGPRRGSPRGLVSLVACGGASRDRTSPRRTGPAATATAAAPSCSRTCSRSTTSASLSRARATAILRYPVATRTPRGTPSGTARVMALRMYDAAS